MLNEKEWKEQFQQEQLNPPKEAYAKHDKMLLEFAKLSDEQKKEILRKGDYDERS